MDGNQIMDEDFFFENPFQNNKNPINEGKPRGPMALHCFQAVC